MRLLRKLTYVSTGGIIDTSPTPSASPPTRRSWRMNTRRIDARTDRDGVREASCAHRLLRGRSASVLAPALRGARAHEALRP